MSDEPEPDASGIISRDELPVGFYVIVSQPPGPSDGPFVDVETSTGRSAGEDETGARWWKVEVDRWAIGPFAASDGRVGT